MGRLTTRNRAVRAAAAREPEAAPPPPDYYRHRRRRPWSTTAATSTSRSTRLSLLVVCCAYWLQRHYFPYEYWLPYGPAAAVVRPSRTTHGAKSHGSYIYNGTTTATSHPYARLLSKIYANPLLKGVESVLFHKDGSLYVVQSGTIVRLPGLVDKSTAEDDDVASSVGRVINATESVVISSLAGRPMGGCWSSHKQQNVLYLADVVFGLVRISNIRRNTKATLELVSSCTGTERGNDDNKQSEKSTTPAAATTSAITMSAVTSATPSPIAYAKDVVVGPRTGTVYLIDATDIYVDYRVETAADATSPSSLPASITSPNTSSPFSRNDLPSDSTSRKSNRARPARTRTWDTLYARQLDGLRGAAMGRLLQYNPKTDATTVLVSSGTGNFHFASSLAVNKDESYLIVAEAFGHGNLLRYNVQNGTLDVLIHGQDLGGPILSMDCSPTGDLCYALVYASSRPLVQSWYWRLPSRLSQIARTVIMMLPRPVLTAFVGNNDRNHRRPKGDAGTDAESRIVEFDPKTKSLRWIELRGEKEGTGDSAVDHNKWTGLRVFNDHILYLSSTERDHIGVYTIVNDVR